MALRRFTDRHKGASPLPDDDLKLQLIRCKAPAFGRDGNGLKLRVRNSRIASSRRPERYGSRDDALSSPVRILGYHAVPDLLVAANDTRPAPEPLRFIQAASLLLGARR